jgi:hypothetical protein
MSVAKQVTALLEGLTREQLAVLAPTSRRKLAYQLHRVYRAIEDDRIVNDAKGVLKELKHGRGRD